MRIGMSGHIVIIIEQGSGSHACKRGGGEKGKRHDKHIPYQITDSFIPPFP